MSKFFHILEELPNQISLIREKFSIPAYAAAVVYQDEVVFAQGQGTRTVGGIEPVDEQSLFALASISKSTAAACLGILVDEGRLAWDDPVRKYLPEFALQDNFATQEISVRDLLIHNSGLPSESGGTIWYGSTLQRSEVLQRLRFLKPERGFRTGYAYQNVTFLAAGEVIAAVSGKSWDDFVRERIFSPLGMRRTVTSLPELKHLDNVTSPHAFFNDQVKTIAYRSHDNIGPAAAVNSSVWDWAQYIRMHLNSGEFNGERILSPERVSELWSAQTPIAIKTDSRLPEILIPNFNAYGMGWFLRDYRGEKLVYHSGGVDGMRTLMVLLPRKKFGMALFTNLEPGYGLYPLKYWLLDQFLGFQDTPGPELWFQQFEEFQSKQRKSKEAQGLPQDIQAGMQFPLEAYCGVYQNPLVGNVELCGLNGGIRMSFEVNPVFSARLTPTQGNTFLIKWDDDLIPDGYLSFELDQQTRPGSIVFNQPRLIDVDFAELLLKRKS